ncbi:MAG: hypothetical protein IPK27_17840 [Rhodanobacteraceae bacterium]|nr:hypothetical protein [Rhodanobacteraceae bacterium]
MVLLLPQRASSPILGDLAAIEHALPTMRLDQGVLKAGEELGRPVWRLTRRMPPSRILIGT